MSSVVTNDSAAASADTRVAKKRKSDDDHDQPPTVATPAPAAPDSKFRGKPIWEVDLNPHDSDTEAEKEVKCLMKKAIDCARPLAEKNLKPGYVDAKVCLGPRPIDWSSWDVCIQSCLPSGERRRWWSIVALWCASHHRQQYGSYELQMAFDSAEDPLDAWCQTTLALARLKVTIPKFENTLVDGLTVIQAPWWNALRVWLRDRKPLMQTDKSGVPRPVFFAIKSQIL